jgi:hypothetical protein
MTTTGRHHRHGLRGALAVALAALGTAAIAAASPAAASPAAAATSTSTATRTSAAAASIRPATALPHSAGQPDLGPNVYVFNPSMPQSEIQATVDAIATQQIPNQFGTQRYALLFEPGTYGSPTDPLTFQVGYYTEVAGLGAEPGDTVINGTIDVYNQCFGTGTSDCVALDNFWRSLSNLTINIAGQPAGCQFDTDFWAVSQAAPLRRVDITGGTLSLMDYCNGSPDYASGGFIADSEFGGTIVNGSQQQFIVRNSDLNGWSNGVWNQVFSGDNGAPPTTFPPTSSAGPYTTLAASPETQEQPFLYQDSRGGFRVFVPALEHDSVGPSWASGQTPGTSVPIGRFFVATPSTSVRQINQALALGRDLILTPGVYGLAEPIVVNRPDTIVLGLGFATLVPLRGTPAMVVTSVPGVKLSGLIFDAGPVNSRVLLQVGLHGRLGSSPADPTLVQDVFFRIGGATPGKATASLVVNSSHVILDDIWAWRADHGSGVGWTDNTADSGVIVNGDDVIAYGLFVEHYQKYQVIWNGQGGTDIFFQNEMPYDPPSQAAWMSGPATDGYAAFLVGPRVTTFTGYGLGSYCYFDQGIAIEATQAFQVPDTPGVQLNDILTRFLNGSGGIESVVNGTGAAVDTASPGPTYLASYP